MPTQIRVDSVAYCEVFSAHNCAKNNAWTTIGATREYSKILRGFVLSLRAGTKGRITCETIQRDLLNKCESINPHAPLFIIQVSIPEHESFGFEFGILHANESSKGNANGRRSRLIFTTNVTSVKTDPLHSKIPLILPRDIWINLIFDVREFVPGTFAIDAITLLPSCRLRRIIQCDEVGSTLANSHREITVPVEFEYHASISRSDVWIKPPGVCGRHEGDLKMKIPTETSRQPRKTGSRDRKSDFRCTDFKSISNLTQAKEEDSPIKSVSLLEKSTPIGNSIVGDARFGIPGLSLVGDRDVCCVTVRSEEHQTESLSDFEKESESVRFNAHSSEFSSDDIQIAHVNVEAEILLTSSRTSGVNIDYFEEETLVDPAMKNDITTAYSNLRQLLKFEVDNWPQLMNK